MKHCLILGCGYTGIRIAKRLWSKGFAITATTRNAERQAKLQSLGCRVEGLDLNDEEALLRIADFVDKHSRGLLSIPPLKVIKNGVEYFQDPTARIVKSLGEFPARVVYLSTTGVYGKTRFVQEQTPVAPVTERQHRRVEAEHAVANGPWTSLILRPAAIYGPGRGIQSAIKKGDFRLAGNGDNFVSRIHVEDLSDLVVAALESNITGHYPAADENPCTSREIAFYCAGVLGLPEPISGGSKLMVGETRQANRQVDGKAICKMLGVTLRYPSYREGVVAALAHENGEESA